MNKLKIGILGIQGDVPENIRATKQALSELGDNADVYAVKKPNEILEIDGLIIPGGESTMIGQMSLLNGSLKQIKEKIESGMPVFGICAGLILLSKTAKDRTVGKTDQPLLDILDVSIERNSFGRQKDSFESELSLNAIQIPKFKGVFIRAPAIIGTGPKVEILSQFNEKIVAVKQQNILGTAFHPELTSDTSIHQYFIKMIKQSKLN